MKFIALVSNLAVLAFVDGKAIEIQANSTPKAPKKTCAAGFLYHEPSNTCYEEDQPGPCPSSLVFTFDLHVARGSNLTTPLDLSKEDLTSGEEAIGDFLGSQAEYDEEELLKALEERQKTKSKEGKPADTTNAKAGDPDSDEHPYAGVCDCRTTDLGECKRRPTLYHTLTSQCYPMFSQGPCTSGEWFVAREYEVPQLHLIEGVCTKNPCAQTTSGGGAKDPSDFEYHFKGACYRTGTQGHCSSAEQIAFFSDLSHYKPQCGNLKKYGSLCYADSSEDEGEEDARLLFGLGLDDYEDASVEKVKGQGGGGGSRSD